MSGIITRSTSRAAELIQSFKQVAIDRTNEGRRDFGVRALCEDIVTSLKAGMRKAPAIITIDIPGSLECDSYPGPLGQILSNLVQNAIVHAFGERTDGRIAIAATLDSTGSRPTVVLTVTDDGVGMSEHTRSHAFDPFFTTRFGQGGSGLGLSIAHKLAASTLEGSLSVESSPGRGSCFTLRMAQHVDGT
jgi:signal transduction histidine kinase